VFCWQRSYQILLPFTRKNKILLVSLSDSRCLLLKSIMNNTQKNIPKLSKAIFFYTFSAFLFIALIFIARKGVYFYEHSYQEILNDYLNAHTNLYRHHLFGEQLFTQKTYEQAPFWILLGWNVAFLLNLLWWYYKKKVETIFEEIINDVIFILKTIRKNFKSHSSVQKKMLGGASLLILIHLVFMYRTVFVAMDETFSWLYFASQGIKVTATHYPVPNNHIFYNVCTSFWSTFIPDTILAMRATSLIAFGLLLLTIYTYLYQKVSFFVAFLSVVVVGLGFSQSVFAVQARGYMLCTLLIVIALFCLLEYLQNKKNGYLLMFMISCIMGFYTIPVFLYAMVAFCAYVCWEWMNKRQPTEILYVFFKVGVLIVGIVFLLYLPVLVCSGKEALLGNENVNPKDYDAHWFFTYILPIATRESVMYVYSFPKYVSFVVAFLTFVAGSYLYFQKKIQLNPFFKKFWTFLIISVVTAFLIICLMRAFPFYRVWTYYAVFVAITTSLMLEYWRKIHNNIFLMIIAFVIFVYSFFQFWREIQDFYDPVAYKNHKNLEKQTQEFCDKQQKIYVSEEAFYVRFWVEYNKATHLLVDNPCEADVAVLEIPETKPNCQRKNKDIWFLRFYQRDK
jgi:hypothetical protein